jgi:hypothetical protein
MSGTDARGTTPPQRLNELLGTPDATTPKPDKSLDGLGRLQKG